jgi:hypothetical protein
MAATINIREWNGPFATPVKTNKDGTTCRFKSADTPTVNTSNPVIIPGSGQQYSFEKWLRFYIGATPPSSYIENLKFYTDGSGPLDTGVVLWGTPLAAWATPVEPSNANDPPHLGTGGTATTTPAATAYTAYPGTGTAMALSTGTITGTSTDVGSFCVLCLEVNSGASPGVSANDNVTFQYDEV